MSSMNNFWQAVSANVRKTMEWAGTGQSRKIMKASEIIEKVQAIIDKHGDLEVYSYCDYQYVRSVEYCEDGAMGTGNSGQVILLS